MENITKATPLVVGAGVAKSSIFYAKCIGVFMEILKDKRRLMTLDKSSIDKANVEVDLHHKEQARMMEIRGLVNIYNLLRSNGNNGIGNSDPYLQTSSTTVICNLRKFS